MECPNCHTNLEPALIIPPEQRFTASFEFEGSSVAARSIGGILTQVDKLMVAIAKDAGVKIVTMVESIGFAQGKLNIGFALIRMKSPVEKEAKP